MCSRVVGAVLWASRCLIESMISLCLVLWFVGESFWMIVRAVLLSVYNVRG
jgi:hypothetical protein